MRIELRHAGQLVADGETSDKGTLEVSGRVATGFYDAVFHVADWYRRQQVDLPEVPFLEVVTYRFGVSNPDQHYHLPLKCTPWGYSCFRGGA